MWIFRRLLELDRYGFEDLVERNRLYRAVALSNGLDPDTVCPEDLLLLGKDKDGALVQVKTSRMAMEALGAYLRRLESRAKDACRDDSTDQRDTECPAGRRAGRRP